jgi:uncharacterized repeat protein (TIGR01451 family)
VTNLGPGKAYGVVLTDDLNGMGLVNIQAVIENPDLLPEPADSCGVIASVVICDFTEIGDDEAEVVNITADTTVASCAGINNTASAAAAFEHTASLGNNFATYAIDVNCPDLEVVKTATNSPISAGDLAEFTVTVTNNGAGAATNVKVYDVFPSSLTWDVVPGQPTCEAGTFMALTVIECTFAEIAANGSEIIALSATTTAESCGILHNEVYTFAANEEEAVTIVPIEGELPDVQGGVNWAEADIVVECPDLVIEKTAAEEVVENTLTDEVRFRI